MTYVPGAATHLDVTGLTSTTAGTLQSATVTARDAFNNVATAYAGSIHLTSTDGQAVLGADNTLTGGVGQLRGHAEDAGSQTVTATGSIGAITGSQTRHGQPCGHRPLRRFGACECHGRFTDQRDRHGQGRLQQYQDQLHRHDPFHELRRRGRAARRNYTFLVGDAGVHTFASEVTLKTAGVQTVIGQRHRHDRRDRDQPQHHASTRPRPRPSSSRATPTRPPPVTARLHRHGRGRLRQHDPGLLRHRPRHEHRSARPSCPRLHVHRSADCGSHGFSATLKTAGEQSISATDTVDGSITDSQTDDHGHPGRAGLDHDQPGHAPPSPPVTPRPTRPRASTPTATAAATSPPTRPSASAPTARAPWPTAARRSRAPTP